MKTNHSIWDTTCNVFTGYNAENHFSWGLSRIHKERKLNKNKNSFHCPENAMIFKSVNILKNLVKEVLSPM